MIEFDVGVPGSGKTYKAVYSLYSNFGINTKFKDSKFIHEDIDFAYTNINEINLDSFLPGSVKNIDWDIFYESLSTLHAHYKDKLTDTQLIEKAKELDLFKCLIILDECHNYLDINDKVLIWWLSYHRHFSQQIYLITQNLALIYTKYKSFSEFFYRARPSSLKLFKSNMIYSQFPNSRMSNNTKSGTLKIPFIKEIFDSYHSGANQQSENIIKKFLIIAVLAFIFLIFMIMLIKSYWSPDNETSNNDKLINSQIANQAIQTYQTYQPQETYTTEKSLGTDLKLFKFNCFEIFCHYQFENKEVFEIPNKILTEYLKDIDDDKKYFELKNNRLLIYVLVPETKFNFIKQGVRDENENQNFSDVLSFSK